MLAHEREPLEDRKYALYTETYNKITRPGNLKGLIKMAIVMNRQDVTIFDERALSSTSIDYVHFFTFPFEGKPSLYSLLYDRLVNDDFIIYIDRVPDEDIHHVIVKIIWHASIPMDSHYSQVGAHSRIGIEPPPQQQIPMIINSPYDREQYQGGRPCRINNLVDEVLDSI